MNIPSQIFRSKLVIKQVVATVTVVISVVLIISGFEIESTIRRQADDVESRIQHIVKSFMGPISTSVWNLDNEAIQENLDSLNLADDIATIRLVMSGAGNLNETYHSSIVSISENSNTYNDMIVNYIVSNLDISLEKKYKINYNERVIGSIYVGVDQKKFKEIILDSIYRAIHGFVILSFFLGFFLFLSQYYFFTRHINLLVQFLIKERDQNNSMRLSIQPLLVRKDEIGALAVNVVSLLVELEDKIKELSDANTKIDKLLNNTLKHLQITYDNMSHGLALITDDNVVVTCNQKLSEILQLAHPVTAKSNLLECIDGIQPLSDFMIPADNRVEDACNVVDFQLSSGIWIEAKSTRIEHDDMSVIVLSDITERILNEERLRTAKADSEAAYVQLSEASKQLVQSEKMAALGTLVAGVAHEVNTPVGVCVTAVSTLKLKTTELEKNYNDKTLRPEFFEKYIQDTKSAMSMTATNLARASDLIKSFKKVAVNQHIADKKTFQIIPLVEESMLSLKHELKLGQHKLVVNGDDAIIVHLTPNILWQVLSNLVLNSIRHGFKDIVGGTIKIKVEQLPDGIVCLSIEDNGHGMNDEVIEKCYDPFFTTARGHGGSGLGLSIVHNLVIEGLGGSINIEKLNRGVIFKIYFPNNMTDFTKEVKL